MEKRSIQNTRNKVFIVFIRQGEVVDATQVVGRLKVEKLVVERGLNMKQRQPTGHLQRHQPRLQLLGSHEGGTPCILHVLRMKLSIRALSTARAKPHQAGAAYISLAQVVALVTSWRAVVGSP